MLLSHRYSWEGFENLLNVSIEVLYEVSTCTHTCRGGDHRIEYITGRAYNLEHDQKLLFWIKAIK